MYVVKDVGYHGTAPEENGIDLDFIIIIPLLPYCVVCTVIMTVTVVLLKFGQLGSGSLPLFFVENHRLQ